MFIACATLREWNNSNIFSGISSGKLAVSTENYICIKHTALTLSLFLK